MRLRSGRLAERAIDFGGAIILYTRMAASETSGMDLPARPVEIGQKLRHLRRLKGLTLMELAEKVDCSESLLSKIENDKVRPSVRILHGLVAALEANVGMLLQGGSGSEIALRPHQRLRFTAASRMPGRGVTMENLIPTPGSALLQATIHLIEPGGGSEGPIEHVGEEAGYVLEGQLELRVGGQLVLLHAGDSFYFRSELPHEFRNPGDTPARVIWVNTPATF